MADGGGSAGDGDTTLELVGLMTLLWMDPTVGILGYVRNEGASGQEFSYENYSDGPFQPVCGGWASYSKTQPVYDSGGSLDSSFEHTLQLANTDLIYNAGAWAETAYDYFWWPFKIRIDAGTAIGIKYVCLYTTNDPTVISSSNTCYGLVITATGSGTGLVSIELVEMTSLTAFTSLASYTFASGTPKWINCRFRRTVDGSGFKPAEVWVDGTKQIDYNGATAPNNVSALVSIAWKNVANPPGKGKTHLTAEMGGFRPTDEDGGAGDFDGMIPHTWVMQSYQPHCDIIKQWTRTLLSDSGTSTAGTDATHVFDSGKAWTTNQWINYSVTMTSGAANGQTKVISSNTATSVVCAAFSPAPSPGDTYSIATTSTKHYRLIDDYHDDNDERGLTTGDRLYEATDQDEVLFGIPDMGASDDPRAVMLYGIGDNLHQQEFSCHVDGEARSYVSAVRYGTSGYRIMETTPGAAAWSKAAVDGMAIGSRFVAGVEADLRLFGAVILGPTVTKPANNTSTENADCDEPSSPGGAARRVFITHNDSAEEYIEQVPVGGCCGH